MPGVRLLNQSPLTENRLMVSWPAPTNRNFLIAYRVSFTTSQPTRRRTQTPGRTVTLIEISPDRTSTLLMFSAFTDYMVDVDAVYAPPPDASNVTVRLLPTTTFRTPERGNKLQWHGYCLHNSAAYVYIILITLARI